MFCAGAATAGINRWTSTGPYGGPVQALAVDPGRPAVVYAGIPWIGVFKTVDGGDSWSSISRGLEGLTGSTLAIRFLVVDPIQTSNLYAGFFYGGVFKSSDGGATWQKLGFDAVTGLAIDPRRSSTVYVAADSGIYKSLDGGMTWSARLPTPQLAFGLVMDAAQPDVLYTLSRDDLSGSRTDVYRTEDGGASWAPTGSFFSDKYIHAMTVDPASSRVFVTTDEGIFRSADRGASWSRILEGFFYSVAAVRPSELYAQDSPAGILQSLDGGDHWSPLSLAGGGAVFAASSTEPALVYAGVPSGVSRSTDRGASWVASSNGLRGLHASPAMNPLEPAVVYAGSDAGGLFRSDDGARAWSLVSSSLYSVAVSSGSPVVYSTLGRSEDRGATWQDLHFPIEPPVDPVVVPNSPETLFVGSVGLRGEQPAQVFKSTDVGVTWTLMLDSGILGGAFLVVSSSGSRVYATISGGRFTGPKVLQSDDGGASWVSTDTSGWPTYGYPWDLGILAIDPSNPQIVYSYADGSVYRSDIGGGHWMDIGAGLPAGTGAYARIVSSLVTDPSAPETIYASTSAGVFRSPNRGATWTRFTDGLPDGSASGLVIDATGRFLHVSAGGGVYSIEIAPDCAATPSSLCLLGGRFVATVEAVDPRTGRHETGHAVAQDDRWGYFSLPGFTGDPGFPEVMVKMADASSAGGGFWIFHSGLTDLQYTLTLTDTVAGSSRSYQNDRSDPSRLCGGADTSTFTGYPDVARASSKSAASAPASSLTLLGRFEATLTAVDPRTGTEAAGVAVASDAKWGYFSLPTFTGDSGFPEVFVKMLDATALPGGFFWLFHTGLTDLEYTLTVTDKTTGAIETYRNDRSEPSRLCGGADTRSFHD